MSSVSCLFESDIDGVYEQQQKRLSDIASSWGFQIHPVPGDGNCCFTALAFSIHSQRQNIESNVPNLLLDAGIEKDVSISEISFQL